MNIIRFATKAIGKYAGVGAVVLSVLSGELSKTANNRSMRKEVSKEVARQMELMNKIEQK